MKASAARAAALVGVGALGADTDSAGGTVGRSGGVGAIAERSTVGIDLEFTQAVFPFGLLHYLGTKGKTAPYQNPHDIGAVEAAASSIMGGNVSWFVGNTKKSNYSQKAENSWMSFTLTEAGSCMVVKHYCLRNDDVSGGSPRSPLRNWELQGSNDRGAMWTTIKRHEKDASIAQGSGTVADWAIAEQDQRPYSSFRIFNFGVNAAGEHMLCCSGIELYGRYYPKGLSAATTPSAATMKLRISCPSSVYLRIRPKPNLIDGEVGALSDGAVIEVFQEEVSGFYRLVDGRVRANVCEWFDQAGRHSYR